MAATLSFSPSNTLLVEFVLHEQDFSDIESTALDL